MFAQWVKDALAHAKISQAELARQLTTRLRRSIDRAAVNKMTLDKRTVAADEMLAIEEITGFPALMDNGGETLRVPLLSMVSAGGLSPREPVHLSDVEDFITANGLPPGEWVALGVDGDSMDLVSPHGSIIFVNRSDTHLIDGAYYVVRLENDEGTTFKRYRDKPEHFQPVSSNKDHGPILLDVPYYVVGRVHRTMLDLKPETKRSRR